MKTRTHTGSCYSFNLAMQLAKSSNEMYESKSAFMSASSASMSSSVGTMPWGVDQPRVRDDHGRATSTRADCTHQHAQGSRQVGTSDDARVVWVCSRKRLPQLADFVLRQVFRGQ